MTSMLKCNANQRDMQMDYKETSMNYATTGSNPCPMPSCPPSQTCCCPPITECPQNQVCHRTITYEVPHIMPMNTTVVNHHIYNHTYTPVYSYNEVDEVENVYNRCDCK